MKKRLGKEFEQFAKCIPADAVEAQKWDMQVAFYAGATSLLNLIMGGLTSDSEPTEQDLHMMDNLHTELTEFQDLLKIKSAQAEA